MSLQGKFKGVEEWWKKNREVIRENREEVLGKTSGTGTHKDKRFDVK